MARARSHSLAAARLVLAPLLAVVAALAGLLLGPAGLSALPRSGAAALTVAAPLARAQQAGLALLPEASRGPAVTCAGAPAKLGAGRLGLRDEAGRLLDEGQGNQDESLTSNRLGLRPQLLQSHKRAVGDLSPAVPRSAGLLPFPGIASPFAAAPGRRAHHLRDHVRIASIAREAHAPRGPPSPLPV